MDGMMEMNARDFRIWVHIFSVLHLIQWNSVDVESNRSVFKHNLADSAFKEAFVASPVPLSFFTWYTACMCIFLNKCRKAIFSGWKRSWTNFYLDSQISFAMIQMCFSTFKRDFSQPETHHQKKKINKILGSVFQAWLNWTNQHLSDASQLKFGSQ